MSLDVFISFLSQPLVLTAIIILLFILAGVFIRRRQRRRAVREIEAMAISELPNATEDDRRAYEFLRKKRAELWQEWEQERDLSPKTFYDVAFSVVRPIAALYFPDDEQPHLRARVEDLVRLNNRIYSRAQVVLDQPFLNKLRRMDIDTILKLRRGMTLVMSNPLVQFIRNKEFRKHWNNIFAAINVLNPWYWFRRVLTEYSIEMAFRYFFTFFVTVIGEEAVLLYGRPQMDDPVLAANRITANCILTMLSGRDRTAEEYDTLYDWLLHESSLESEERLDVLKRLHADKALKVNEKDVAGLVEIGREKACLDALERIALAGGLTEEKEQVHKQVSAILENREGSA